MDDCFTSSAKLYIKIQKILLYIILMWMRQMHLIPIVLKEKTWEKHEDISRISKSYTIHISQLSKIKTNCEWWKNWELLLIKEQLEFHMSFKSQSTFAPTNQMTKNFVKCSTYRE